MSNSRAAIRYAKAVLDFSVAKKTADKVDDDMRTIASTINENAALQDLLESPVIKIDIKKKTLAEVFKGSNEITSGLISTLADNKRIALLQEVAYKYIILHEKLKGEAIAYVTTAVPMTTELEKKVLAQVKKMTGNKVTLENKVDEL